MLTKYIKNGGVSAFPFDSECRAVRLYQKHIRVFTATFHIQIVVANAKNRHRQLDIPRNQYRMGDSFEYYNPLISA